VLTSCEKFLDEKSNKALKFAETLKDAQALLDDQGRLIAPFPYIGEVSSDNMYVLDANLASVASDGDRRMYTWEKDNVFQGEPNNWADCYRVIYYGNTALEIAEKVGKNASNVDEYNNVKGQAHFYKGLGLFNVATIWASFYEPATAASALGVPIRESTDFNVVSKRSTLAETYGQLLLDLKMAAALLPRTTVHPIRPSKAGVFGMLSRVYLSMNNYQDAQLYADSALQINSSLLNFNTLSTTANFPVTDANVEVLFYAYVSNAPISRQANANVDQELVKQYHKDDLRRVIYLRDNGNGNFVFKGNFTASSALFGGPSVNEMYLNRAECLARANQLNAALDDLNTLMVSRWNKNFTYPRYQSTDQATVLNWILTERRKELLMRGIRWLDLRRLNKLGANIVVKRTKNAVQTELLPNSLRYVLPIPEKYIRLTCMSSLTMPPKSR
ncbi:MAG: RagB/SusD family nutrient uptake outer membrane protein, partial [Chitinophagaceae bacterium]